MGRDLFDARKPGQAPRERVRFKAWKPDECADCGKAHPSYSLNGRAGPWRCKGCDLIARSVLGQPWWQREGLSEPCPNWRPETRRCNCADCRARRADPPEPPAPPDQGRLI